MHNGNRDLGIVKLVDPVNYMLADTSFFLLGKLCQCTIGTLSDCIDNLLYVKGLLAAVLFDYIDIFFRSILQPIIHLIRLLRLFEITAHKPHPS